MINWEYVEYALVRRFGWREVEGNIMASDFDYMGEQIFAELKGWA